MKFLPSPFTAGFHAPMCNSCGLAGILRRFFSSRPSPPPITHSASDFNPNSTGPGIVARLMGLDSFEIRDQKGPSFLEMPASFELENEDFFILSFEKRSKGEKRRRKKSKSKEKESKKVQLNPKKLDAEQEDCSSENSSPVSVLAFDKFDTDECVIMRRRKLSSRLEDYHRLWRQIDHNSVGNEQNPNIIEESCPRLRFKFCNTKHHFNICKMVKTEVVQSNWDFDDLQDISAFFGLGILDDLLEELIDQFH